MKKENLTDQLFNNGLIEEGNIDKINAFKIDHRKKYLSDYQTNFRKKTIRKTLIFSKEEFQILTEQAEKSNMKLSPFLKEIIFAYLSNSYVYPQSQSIQNIETLLREIQQRISDTVMYIHMNDKITVSDMQNISHQIKVLESFIQSTVKNPPHLESFIQEQLKQDKYFLSKFLKAISHYLISE